MAARGILVAIASFVALVGTGFLLVYTNLGKRLGLLVTGAALFGWLTIGSMLFVVYAPRGLRPSSVQGLGSIEIRIPAMGLTVASLILFIMFIVALDKYENETDI
ncbi:MAG TPA: sugar transferase [Actinobacteria bacterium]|nr:sugar transferase [Actinomycetota bacterium]